MTSRLKPIQWLGDSLDRLRKLPDAARRAAGHELRLVQSGLPATDWRPMPVIGNGVAEIRIHAKGEYRVLYVARARGRDLRHTRLREEDSQDVFAGCGIGTETVPGADGKAQVMRVTRGSDNIFDDFGFPPAEAEHLRIRSTIMIALVKYIQEKKLTQMRAAEVMGVSQPRISALVRGKIGHFTIDALTSMAVSAGLKVEVGVTPGKSKAKSKRVA